MSVMSTSVSSHSAEHEATQSKSKTKKRFFYQEDLDLLDLIFTDIWISPPTNSEERPVSFVRRLLILSFFLLLFFPLYFLVLDIIGFLHAFRSKEENARVEVRCMNGILLKAVANGTYQLTTTTCRSH